MTGEQYVRANKRVYNVVMNLYAENVSLGSGSDGMSNGMYASSDPLAGWRLAARLALQQDSCSHRFPWL